MFGGGLESRTTTAFGQTSTFGKPTTGFSSGFGTPNTSLFGQTTQPTTSLFGSTAPSFGQTTTTKSFGNFGAGSGTSLFGTSQTQAGTSEGLFGSQNTTGNAAGGGLFESPNSTAFRSNTGFGTSGSPSNTSRLFGQNQQSGTQPSLLFGSGNTAGSLFGSASCALSSGETASGTAFKFNLEAGSDTVSKNGIVQTISTKHQCITCMKEYENKSSEKLRYEDYIANRKGPAQGAQTGASLYGGTGPTPFFGGSTSTANAGGANFFGNSGFGQTSVFGQNSLQPNNSLFGKPASSAPFGSSTTTISPGFSTFGQTSISLGSNLNAAKPTFRSTPTDTGLCNSAAPGTSNFGTQSANFHFNDQQQNQGIGLFGQQYKFGGFGPQTTSNFTCGSPASSTNTTSLFGQKPTTTSFGIAPTSTPSTSSAATPFGAGCISAGDGLFGSGLIKPANPGLTFKQNTTASAGLDGAATIGRSLFGGAANKQTNPFGGTSSSTELFGNGFGAPGGFSSVGDTASSGRLNFGGSGSSDGNASGSSLNAPVPNVCDQIQMLSVIPYGTSTLYKHVRPASAIAKNDDHRKSTVVPQMPTNENSNYKISTQINNIIARKAYSVLEPSKKSLFDKVENEFNDKSIGQQCSSPRYLKLKPKTIIKAKSPSKEDSKSRANAPSSEDANKGNVNSSATFSSPTTSTRNDNSISTAEGKEREIPVENDTMLEMNARSKPLLKMGVTYVEDDSVIASSNSSLDNSENLSINSPGPEISIKNHSCDVKLERVDYFTVPSLSELDELMDDEGRCIVKNFTVGRHKYGNVTFYDAFDVVGLDLDSIVFFRHNEIEIYSDDDVKPAVGVGLNRRAQVTLDRVWPIDKATREIINNPERLKQLNFVEKLRRSSAKMNALFIEYRPLTGSWVFEVEHFSKYGLDESDDEECEEIGARKLNKVMSAKVAEKLTGSMDLYSAKPTSGGKKRGLDGGVMFLVRETTTEAVSKPEISLDKGIPDLDLFATGRVDAYRSSVPEKNALPLIKMPFTSQFPPPADIPIVDFSTEEYRPPLYSPELKFIPTAPHVISRPLRVAAKYRNAVFPYEESVFKTAQTSLCDTALYFGQHFKIGWSQKMTLVYPASIFTCNTTADDEIDQLNRLFVGRKSKDFSPNVLCKLQLKTGTSDKFEKNTECHLKICLNESVFSYEDGLPVLTPKNGTKALHEHCDVEQQTVRLDEDYDRQVWELMVALWGNLTNSTSNNANDHKTNITKMLRKEAAST